MIYKEVFTVIRLVLSMPQRTTTFPGWRRLGLERAGPHCQVCWPCAKEGRAEVTLAEESAWCFQKRLDVMCPEPARVCGMWYTWTSVNELFKDWNPDVSFLPCSDEQNIPQRHIFPRPECTGPIFSLAIHFSSFFVICVIILHLYLPLISILPDSIIIPHPPRLCTVRRHQEALCTILSILFTQTDCKASLAWWHQVLFPW